MKSRHLVPAALLALALAVPAHAQDKDAALLPPPNKDGAANLPSDPLGPVHPDLLMHLQEMQRYADPQSLARARAIEKAQMRQARISASKWYGHSPLRPMVSSLPAMGSYYPIWNTDVARPRQWYLTRFPDEVH